MTEAPAYLRNGRRDLLAANRLGQALYSPMFAEPQRPVNVARFVFLDPAARYYFLDWTTAARDMVAALRIEAGRHPHDRALSDLVGELSTRSDEFATFWASQNVRFHRSGLKDIHHPAVGELHLSFEAMDLPADPGLSLIHDGLQRPAHPGHRGQRRDRRRHRAAAGRRRRRRHRERTVRGALDALAAGPGARPLPFDLTSEDSVARRTRRARCVGGGELRWLRRRDRHADGHRHRPSSTR